MSEYEPPKTPEFDLEEPKNITELEQKVATIEKKLAEKESEVQSLNDKIKQLESEGSSSFNDKINNLNETINSYKEEIQSLKAAETENKATIKDLEHRLSQKELEATRLEGSVQDLSIAKKKIEDLQKEHKKLEEEMKAFQKIAKNDPKFIILNDLKEFGEMRLQQISMKAQVSPSQAKKWLEELEQAGLVEIQGEGRDTNPLVSVKKK